MDEKYSDTLLSDTNETSKISELVCPSIINEEYPTIRPQVSQKNPYPLPTGGEKHLCIPA